MHGDSTLWIFTRVKSDQDFDTNAPVIMLKKNQHSEKLVCNIGTFIQRKNKDGQVSKQFQILKTMALPDISYNVDNNRFRDEDARRIVIDDSVDFKFKFIDNGDDKICIQF